MPMNRTFSSPPPSRRNQAVSPSVWRVTAASVAGSQARLPRALDPGVVVRGLGKRALLLTRYEHMFYASVNGTDGIQDANDWLAGRPGGAF